ncbi:MAG: peptidylprolyl isomerase [Phycisphaeraceae bacterium]|nr:peptidylprolyl isomerase [Phycisphaeraceae bacterium]
MFLGIALLVTGIEQPRDKPAAIVANESIEWSELTPRLAEAAGGVVLEEVILERALARELTSLGMSIDKQDIEEERRLLAESVDRTAKVGSDERVRLIEQIREARGLGPARFGALLRRNAMLRRLARDSVKIEEQDLRQAYELRYGPQFRTRAIIAKSEVEAAAARSRVIGDGGRAPEPFGEVAMQVSIDQSRYRGGLQEPISPADPETPLAVRQALAGLAAGEVSQPIAVGGAFAIIKLEEQLPGSGPGYDAAKADLEAEVRLVRERVVMDQIARRLLGASNPTVFDAGIDWSWRVRSSTRNP